MDEPNFFTALNQFAASVKTFRQSATINEVNQRAQEIKSSIEPDMQKRQNLASLADDAFMRLLSQGVDPQTAQAARVSLIPPTASSAEQAMVMGRMTGDEAMYQAGMELTQAEEARKMRQMYEQAKIQEGSQMRLFAQQSAMQEKSLAAAEDRANIAAGRAAMKPTGDQWKVAGFVNRMSQAEGDLRTISKLGVKGNEYISTAGLPNALQSGEQQRLNQAKTNFISAVLRRESGAAISDEEYAREERKYFPMRGDSKETVQQKARTRAMAAQGMAAEAGPAWEQLSQRTPGAVNLYNDQVSDVNSLTPKLPAKSYIKVIK